jgi:hypothetical protein
VVVYLAGEKALTWWHRNVVRSQYGLQGWKKARIYPDFIFAIQTEGEAKRITVPETKGDQLDNLYTAYKREVLSFLSGAFQWDDYTPAGENWSWSRTPGRSKEGRPLRRRCALQTGPSPSLFKPTPMGD